MHSIELISNGSKQHISESYVHEIQNKALNSGFKYNKCNLRYKRNGQKLNI